MNTRPLLLVISPPEQRPLRVELPGSGVLGRLEALQTQTEGEPRAGSSRGRAAPKGVRFYLRWCKRCGICAAFCPRGALAINAKGQPYMAHPEKCNLCGLCEALCPDFAVFVPRRRRK